MTKIARTKVLIVENDPQVTKELEKLLKLMDNVDIIDHVSTAEEGLELIREVHPDVALVDISLPDMSGLSLIEAVRQDNPVTQIVIVSEDKNYNTMLRAIRNGASDFVTHEVTLDELTSAVQRAGDLALAEKAKLDPATYSDFLISRPAKERGPRSTGSVITVYSPKGGTGVTSTAINLAIALLADEATVALVDGSMQFGDVPIFLNELPKFSIVDLVPRIQEMDQKVVEDVLVFHKTSGLHLLTAPSRPELAEKVNGNHLSQILEFLRQMFSYVVVNTSSYISDHCLAALDAGDVIVLVTTQEIVSIRGARAFLELWDGLSMSKERVLLAINRYDKQKNITPDKVGEILKHPVAETIPLDEETALRAANYGIPFIVGNKSALISQSMVSLAGLVRERLGEVEVEGRLRLFSLV